MPFILSYSGHLSVRKGSLSESISVLPSLLSDRIYRTGLNGLYFYSLQVHKDPTFQKKLRSIIDPHISGGIMQTLLGLQNLRTGCMWRQQVPQMTKLVVTVTHGSTKYCNSLLFVINQPGSFVQFLHDQELSFESLLLCKSH